MADKLKDGSVKKYIDDGVVTMTNKTLTSPVINTGVSGTAIDTDITLAANSNTKLASQKATKTYVDNASSSPFYNGGVGLRPSGLNTWYDALNLSTPTAPVDVIVIGDSISRVPDYKKSWPSVLTTNLNNLRGAASTTGIISGHDMTSTGTKPDVGLAHSSTVLSTGQTATITENMSSFALVYSTDITYGSIVVRDGGPSGTILTTISCSSTASTGKIWFSSALGSGGTHTIHLAASGGSVTIEALLPLANSSVRVWNTGKSGYSSSQFTSDPTLSTNLINSVAALPDGNIKLVVIATGTNDDPGAAAKLNTLIDLVGTLTPATVAQVIPYRSNAILNSEVDAIRSAAQTRGLPLIDLDKLVPYIPQSMSFDGVHPNGNGYRTLGILMTTVLSGDPIGSVARYAAASNITLERATAGLLGLPSAALGIEDTLSYLTSPKDGIIQSSTYFAAGLGQFQGGTIRTVNSQTGTSYTILLADKSKTINRSNSSASTQTWPKDITADIAIGSIVETTNSGSGTITHSAEAGATITGNLKQPQNTKSVAVKTAANTWFMSVSSLETDTDGTLASNSDSKVPSQKAVKTYVDDFLNSGELAGTTGMRNKKLRNWFTAFQNAKTTPVDIVVFGDSISGSILNLNYDGLNNRESWSRKLANALNRSIGIETATSGWLYALGNTDAPSITSTTGSAPSGGATEYGIGGWASVMTNGQNAIHTGSMDGITIMYTKHPLGGLIEVRDGIGGTLLTTINTYSATTLSGNVWTSGALTYASHTIEMTAVCVGGEKSVLDGVYVHSGTRDKGFRVWQACHGGWWTSIFTNNPNTGLDALTTLNPALVISAGGTNDDTANIDSRNRLMLTMIQARTSADILMWVPYIGSTFFEADRVILKQIASDFNVDYIDATNSIGAIDQPGNPFAYDSIHPNETGRLMIANQIYSKIGGDPFGTVIHESSKALAPKKNQTWQTSALGGYTVSDLFGYPIVSLNEGSATIPAITFAGATYNGLLSGFAGTGFNLGSGTATPDTNIYRSAANTLKTDDTLIIGTPGTSTGSAVTVDGTQTLTNKTLTSPVISTGVSGTAIDTDVTLAGNSDTKLASQKATKAYVDALTATLVANAGGSAWSNSTTETSVQTAAVSIPAGTIKDGDTIEFEWIGNYQNNTGAAQTNTYRFKLNGTAIWSPVYTPATSAFAPVYSHRMRLTRLSSTTLLRVIEFAHSTALNAGFGNRQMATGTETVSNMDSNALTIDLTSQMSNNTATSTVTPSYVFGRLIKS